MAAADQVSGFRNEVAKQRFLRDYERAFRKWPVPREELDVKTRFGTVHVHRSGGGPGTPIVLLHGISVASAHWYPNITTWSANHAAYALDSLGENGRSVHRKPIRDFADCAAWIHDALDELDLDRVHVIGASQGGWNAANFATRYSERLVSLTLIDSIGLGRFSNRFLFAALLDVIAMHLPDRLGERITTETIPDDRDLLRLTRAAVRRDFTIRLPSAHVFSDDELRRLTMPTLALIAGRATSHNPCEVQARLNALLPSVDAEIVQGRGHRFGFERPDLVNDRVLHFIESAEVA